MKTRQLFAITLVAAAAASANADAPGKGLTAKFEIEFMQMTIDHHFAALRMTELAAGTERTRTGVLRPQEGTSPTSGFSETAAKATLEDLKSLARRNNRMQREEIQTLQTFLRDWYRIEYQPRVRPETQPLINALEQARPGSDFNHAFLEAFSRHHYTLLEPLNACMTGTELIHFELRNECRQAWHSQTMDIDMMRHDLKKHFRVEDYQPFNGRAPLQSPSGSPKGQHSGNEPT